MHGFVDIRIMAHPSRAKNVRRMLDALNLPDSIVVWDDRENGGDAMYTARKAWEYPVPDGCTHRLVLQDDAELCDGFLNIVDQIAASNPRSIVTLFHTDSICTNKRYAPDGTLYGVAVMMPAYLIPKLWAFVDNDLIRYTGPTYDRVIKRDTTCMRLWVANEHIPCVTTVPSLVQHIGDESLVGDSRIRTAPDFEKNPSLEGW